MKKRIGKRESATPSGDVGNMMSPDFLPDLRHKHHQDQMPGCHLLKKTYQHVAKSRIFFQKKVF